MLLRRVHTRQGEVIIMSTNQNNKAETSKRLEDEVASLKADMAKLREDIAALTAALGATAADYVAGAKERASEKAADAREKVNAQINQAADTGKQVINDLEAQVGQRPIASLLTAASIGFIVAKLLDLGNRR